MPEIMIARRPGTVVINGQRRMVRKGVTTADADHPIVRDHPRLWEPLKVTHSSGGADQSPDEGDDAARRWHDELERLADGLRERGIEAENPDREGWVVDTALAALDRWAESELATDEPTDDHDQDEATARARIREWAANNGIEVKRGKIPQAVVDQYEAAVATKAAQGG